MEEPLGDEQMTPNTTFPTLTVASAANDDDDEESDCCVGIIYSDDNDNSNYGDDDDDESAHLPAFLPASNNDDNINRKQKFENKINKFKHRQMAQKSERERRRRTMMMMTVKRMSTAPTKSGKIQIQADKLVSYTLIFYLSIMPSLIFKNI